MIFHLKEKNYFSIQEEEVVFLEAHQLFKVSFTYEKRSALQVRRVKELVTSES